MIPAHNAYCTVLYTRTAADTHTHPQNAISTSPSGHIALSMVAQALLASIVTRRIMAQGPTRGDKTCNCPMQRSLHHGVVTGATNTC